MTRAIFNQDVKTRQLPRALQSEIIYNLPSPSLSSILTERALLNFSLPTARPVALATHFVTSLQLQLSHGEDHVDTLYF